MKQSRRQMIPAVIALTIVSSVTPIMFFGFTRDWRWLAAIPVIGLFFTLWFFLAPSKTPDE